MKYNNANNRETESRIQRLIAKIPKREAWPVTEYDLRQREEQERQRQYLLTLGIDTYTTDKDDDNDPDKMLAFLYVLEGKKVPKDLEKKLLEKERKRKEREANKNK